MTPIEWSEEGRVQLFAAYSKAQAAMGVVEKSATNSHFSTKYSTLAAVISAVIPAMSAAGLAVLQSPSFDGEVLTVETIVMHTEGGWLKSSLSVRPGKPDAQGLGSAATYLRRYALMSLAGVAPEDDDGNAASVSGEGGKKFEKQAAEPTQHLETFKSAMKLCRSVELVDKWANDNANAIMEKLNRREQDEMQSAYAAWRNELAAMDTPPGDTKAKAEAERVFA